VLQGDKGIVVDCDPRAAKVQFRVHGVDRAEQLDCLVYEVGAEVVQQAAGLLGCAELTPVVPDLRDPALVAGLEPLHVTESAFGDQLSHGPEVAVPPAVLEHRQRDVPCAGGLQHLAGFRRGRRERFVHNHRYARFDRGQRHRHVRPVGRRDHDQVDRGLEEFGGIAQDGHARVLGSRLFLPFSGTGDDRGESQAGCGRDQRCVEDAAGDAVAEHAGSQVGSHAVY
jgi:hypothetical protein